MVTAILIGILAGVISGLLGVGGGALFVPALVYFLGLGQLDAQATSLLAIVPVALVGSWRQWKKETIHFRAAGLIILGAPIGVFCGVFVANILPERVLELLFAGFLITVAVQLIRDVQERPSLEHQEH